MSIANVIDSIKALSSKGNFTVETKLRCEWQRGVEYGGVNEHTSLTGLTFGMHWQGFPYAKVYLTHKCPIGAFREKKISKAPYYCKHCAQSVISAAQGPSFCLPVDTGIVPKLQISIAGLDFKRKPETDFDMGYLVLTQYDGWVHKCSACPNRYKWSSMQPYTKQTLTALPFKCKLCKQRIGEEGMTFDKLANMAKLLGALEKNR